MSRKKYPHDGNSAVAHVAHATNEVIAIYPITPSSPMGEICDEKTARAEKNIWDTIPSVAELQSEAGASGAVHGALTTGSLATTFTASQGLLLMIPNMYKIAGELLPTVFHIAARAIAAQGLSIFGDHSDVMACRSTGWGMLASSNVQEAMDFALISQSATLKSRVPFLHFFEGFRVSHEIQKIEELTFEDMKAMIDDELVKAHRARGLNPECPSIRGTAQNPDVYFQGREVANRYYEACPEIVQEYMDRFAKLVGRQYNLFDYVGAKDAEQVIVVMGSGSEVVHETVEKLTKLGEKVGVLKVRLFRPWKTASFIDALPASVKKIAVLDRTKEPGSLGEPLYEDVRTAIGEAMEQGCKIKVYPKIVGGRFGLGSAEFTPAMVKAIFDNLKHDKPKNHFIIGITDDLTKTSLEFDPKFVVNSDAYQALFYGLGSDGTVGANKNSIKIIADKTDNYAQGYFEYDSKKAGSMTVSHLRFGKSPIRSPYLISNADFLACHNFSFLQKYDMLKNAKDGGIFLLISAYSKDEVWQHIPNKVKKQIVDKKLKFYVIDAIKIAEEVGLGSRVNVIMQTAFFKISKVIDPNIAIDAIKTAIKKTYGKKGDAVVNMNILAVDKALDAVYEVNVPASVDCKIEEDKVVSDYAPDFVKEVTAKLLKREGDSVKTSEMPEDGTWPVGTTQYEKRNIAINVPAWDPNTCIQCGRCSLVCPHGVIRMKLYDEKYLENAPKTFKSAKPIGKDLDGKKFTIQVSCEDCTGCGLCIASCPVPKEKAPLKMVPLESVREQEIENFEYFLNTIPETDPKYADKNLLKGTQLTKPLFEFSGACAGCGETGYVKLLSQLFGDRLVIANATGCSSIYGGNLPTTPYTTRKDGCGPAWSNSLFEDNAEFAFGMRMTVNKYTEFANELCDKILKSGCSNEAKTLIENIRKEDQKNQDSIEKVRTNVRELKKVLQNCKCEDCKQLESIADYLIKKSVWALGGDGWAYDIGYGGLDHVLASGQNINILVLDTEVYSNTGGQASKSTPLGAVAKFAAAGKRIGKKDLAMIAMSYGHIYVAKVSIGADPNQLIKAMNEAEAYDGPSLVIAYAHCVAHGIEMSDGLEEQKKAVASGHWQLLRYNPELALEGKNPLKIDSKPPTISMADYVYGENRYRILKKSNPEISEKLVKEADVAAKAKYEMLKKMSEM